jgi:uracil-DNA glycosylase family 4
MKNDLINLYSEIHNCHICPKMDNYKMLRNIESVDKNTTVFILSQALAEKQLRKTGVNFFKEDGEAGKTGVLLENFLNQFNQTIYPPKVIVLANGNKIRKGDSKYQSVYNTEINQCYPGKGRKRGDRMPEKDEILRCINTGFLFSEIKIIKPKIILLMGRQSTQTFYKYILQKNNKLSLTALINQIILENKIPEVEIFGNKISYLPIQHASGVNPNFAPMCNNERLINLINNFIK